jgi:hypothetical protein
MKPYCSSGSHILCLRFPQLLQWQSYTLSQVSTTGPVAVMYFVSGFHNRSSGSHILCLRFPQLLQWQSCTLSQVNLRQSIWLPLEQLWKPETKYMTATGAVRFHRNDFFFILASNKTISRWPWSFKFLARME